MRLILVTGTGTDVGKTVVTAAIASCAWRAGARVAVVKPVQTGVQPAEPADLAEVSRLSGVEDVHEYARFPAPLAPASAARLAGTQAPTIEAMVERIAGLADRDVVIVEGAGGALVRFNGAGETLLDLAGALDRSVGCETVLVAGSGLGTLNPAGLTAQAFLARGIALRHLVIGCWPAETDLADRCNLIDLPDYAGVPLHGVLPAGAALEAAGFAELAMRSLTPELGGVLDAPDFVKQNYPSPKGRS
ncbi:MAG: dethiobiotin synthase [Actinomycetota bacterium]|nr:dethiobiotin synthase [Actinomycetota bacterium]MDQ2956692.1 dethiobiotin synthase [Actinomycetota bacterium]